MKVRKTRFMKRLLHRGQTMIGKRKLTVAEDYFVLVFDQKTASKWRYQVNYVCDHREHDKPFTSVLAFSPQKPWEIAYYLRSFD